MNKYLRTIELQDGKADVYAVLDAFEVKSHAIGHAIKKLLCAGQRGHKDYRTDLVEAIQAIQREIGEASPVQSPEMTIERGHKDYATDLREAIQAILAERK